MRRMLRIAISGVALSAALSCSSANEGKAKVVCTVSAPTMCPEPAPTFADVAPIFEQRCASSSCHSGFVGGPWPLDDYEHISDWQDVVRAEVVSCSMPPADANVPITDDERLTILNWIRCDLPK
jgi:hypothetical protein